MENNELVEETRNAKKRGKSGDKRRGLDVDDGGKMVSWYSSLVELINKYGLSKMLQAFMLIVLTISFLMFANALNNEEIIEQWLLKTNEEHVVGTEIRNDIQPKIYEKLTKILYELEADRVSVLEMHNGKENATALPFNYFDMTYEETREGIAYVSEEYENTNLSRFTFPNHIYRNKIFIGSVDSIKEIDKKLAIRLETNDVEYVGIIMIRTTKDIGFLMVSYEHAPTVSDEQISHILSYYVQEIGTYLDYKIQKKNKGI